MPSHFDIPGRDLREIVDRVPDLAHYLRDQRLLITGGTGFIGKWLLASALTANSKPDITIITREPDRHRRQYPAEYDALGLLAWDLAQPRPPGPDLSADAVIHAAAETKAGNSPPQVGRDIVDGARHLAAAVPAGAHWLMLSSGAVYDDIASQSPYREDQVPVQTPTMSANTYGLGKRHAEALLIERHCTIARLFAFVGPHLPLRTHFAVGNFIADAIDGNTITVRSSGSAIRSYLYPTDLIVWLWSLLIRRDACSVYNVGSDDAISIADLAHRVAGIGGAVPPRILGEPESGPRNYYTPDITRARNLGLTVEVDLDEAIGRTWDWAKAQRQTRKLRG